MQQVDYFLALCEELNFTRAAGRCGISQPSLTNAMIALERELGGALFERRPGMTFITLTALGHAVHPYLQRIAENADHARDAARALTDAANRDANPIERLKG
jgi:DNA-binding transcriptional LysR family regulator